MAAIDLRLRVATPGLLALPWLEPLADWDPTRVEFRDIPVGPSRHLVRFVEADGRTWALKSMPGRVALREYRVLRDLEARSLAAVRPAGVVLRGADEEAILVTRYLDRSWQYRRLLLRVPASMQVHRARLFDAVAVLLVDLHRNGVYWGDCSLANALFMRDGQVLQAWLVDAETAELHPSLSLGQRRADLEIMVENVAGGLLDVAARREEPPEAVSGILAEAHALADRYEQLWELLHDEPVIGIDQPDAVEHRLRRLNEAGFAVDEVHLESVGDRAGEVRVHVAVAERRFHVEQLRALTGLDVGEGQAQILLDDLRAFQSRMQLDEGHDVAEHLVARHWLLERFTPGVEAAHRAVGGRGDPTQAYCDLLEVRWLLSEAAGDDVGDDPALDALATRSAPGGAAATLGFVDDATRELPIVPPYPERPPTYPEL